MIFRKSKAIRALEIEIRHMKEEDERRKRIERGQPRPLGTPVLARTYEAKAEGDEFVVYSTVRAVPLSSGSSVEPYELARARSVEELKKQLTPKLVTIHVCEEF